MTHQDDFTLPTELLQQVTEQGLDCLPELIRIVINTAMHVELQEHLGVGPYERSNNRQGHANDFKPKTVNTLIAPITFDIPQVREGGFYPQALEKARLGGQVRDAAVLIASGVNLEGKRLVLGVSVSLGEQELHWRDFLQSLVERGLNVVELIISDAHVGLQAASKAVFSGVSWQRCQFHLQQNASQYVPSPVHEARSGSRYLSHLQCP